MTVFKGYMKVLKQNWLLIILYVVIFFGCTLMIQSVAGQIQSSYQAESLKVGIVDEDGGVLAESLKTYLGNLHQIVPLENDISSIQEKLFYREVEYVVRIPENFCEKCIKGGKKMSVTKVPDSYSGVYVDQQINSFLNNARTYLTAGFTEEEAAEALVEETQVKVSILSNGGYAEESQYIYYFRYVPYLFLSVFGFVMGNILIVFKKKDLIDRMLASPVSARRQSLEGLCCMILAGIFLLGIVLVAAVLFYKKDFYGSENFGYYILNTVTLFFVSLSISYLAGMLTPNKDALNGVANIMSLGMSFLCGVFVPLEVMSKKVKCVSQFLPVYWYETANELLGDFSVLTGEARTQFFQAVVIQIVFGVAFVCLILVIGKYRRVKR